MSGTDMPRLADLCARVLAEASREADHYIADEQRVIVAEAQQQAVHALGPEAAGLLGTWIPEPTDDDSVQVAVEVAPGTHLVYAIPADEGARLTLRSVCRSCGHRRDGQIRALADLAEAMLGQEPL